MAKPKAISLFCGAGGCSLGFQQAGFQILYSSDIDKSAIKTYQHNFTDTFSEVKDIQTLNCPDLLSRLNLEKGELDMLLGGPPCQGFSTAGMRFWDDPRNRLLKEYIRCLEEIQPKWFLMENVEGLLTSHKGTYVLEAAKAFIDLGYAIRIQKVYAHEYGIPQRRKRVFIIGNRLGIDFSFPKEKFPATGKRFQDAGVSLKEGLINLPIPSKNKDDCVRYPDNLERSPLFEYYENPQKKVSDHYSPNISDIQQDRIRHISQGQSMKDLPQELQHESFKKRANRRVKDGTPTEKRGGAPVGLRRLVAEQPSLTITRLAIREFIHPTHDRPLTLRECARIQTFPDSFEFKGARSQKIKQVGNAIPPLLAEYFATHIVKEYGFQAQRASKGKLLGFSLRKGYSLSPVLKKTESMLRELQEKTY